MNALTMLKEDHVKVKALLSRLETTTERGVKTRSELFATIKGELTLHETVEEEIFYPALKAHPKAKDIVLEGPRRAPCRRPAHERTGGDGRLRRNVGTLPADQAVGRRRERLWQAYFPTADTRGLKADRAPALAVPAGAARAVVPAPSPWKRRIGEGRRRSRLRNQRALGR